jgi:hypothetical protein
VRELRDCVRKFRVGGAAHRDGIGANPVAGADIRDSRMPSDNAVIAIDPNACIIQTSSLIQSAPKKATRGLAGFFAIYVQRQIKI